MAGGDDHTATGVPGYQVVAQNGRRYRPVTQQYLDTVRGDDLGHRGGEVPRGEPGVIPDGQASGSQAIPLQVLGGTLGAKAYVLERIVLTYHPAPAVCAKPYSHQYPSNSIFPPTHPRGFYSWGRSPQTPCQRENLLFTPSLDELRGSTPLWSVHLYPARRRSLNSRRPPCRLTPREGPGRRGRSARTPPFAYIWAGAGPGPG